MKIVDLVKIITCSVLFKHYDIPNYIIFFIVYNIFGFLTNNYGWSLSDYFSCETTFLCNIVGNYANTIRHDTLFSKFKLLYKIYTI